MSIRQTKLCDNAWASKDPPCPKLAVGTCCVCDKDLCEEHTTFAPDGGISVTFLAKTKHRDGENVVLTHAVRMHICHQCSNGLVTISRERVNEKVKSFGKQMREALRAAFAEKALSAKGDG